MATAALDRPDAQHTSEAELRSATVRATLVMLACVGLVMMVTDVVTQEWVAVAVTGSGVLVSPGLYALAKRGHATLVAHVICAFLVLGSGAIGLNGVGLYGNAVLFLLCAPVVAGLLAGGRGALIWSVVTVLTLGVYYGFHAGGLLEGARSSQPGPGDRLKDMAVVLCLVGGASAAFLVTQRRILRTQQQTLAALQGEVQERRRAEQLAQDAVASREQFIATLSHELRNLLAGSLCATSLIRETDDPVELDELTTVLDQSSRSMQELINGVLNLSKLEAGKVQLESLPVMVRTLVRETLAPLGLMARERGVGWHWVVEDDLPQVIVSDPTRLRQILLNLAGNALKFTREGHVAVHLSQREGLLCIEVHDTGPGIRDSVLETLFEPYQQAASSTERRFGGTGLGLAIVRGIAEAMGGGVEVQTEVGVGSCFTATVALEASVAQGSDTAEAAVDGRGLRVLLVDDNPVAGTLYRRLLGTWGFEAEVTSDGLAAIARVRTDPPDLVLTDCQMPGLSGPELTRRVRAMGGPAARVPIFGLSGDSREDTRQTALDAGMDAFLVKPLRAEPLARALQAWQATAREVRRTG
jgi:signal transduction histidine kinase/ActR/RegA family two-component response regulator